MLLNKYLYNFFSFLAFLLCSKYIFVQWNQSFFCCKLNLMALLMRLCHPPDGSTSPKYKLLCFITTKIFCKEKNALAFNLDRCCHLVLCLQLIPFHCNIFYVAPSVISENVKKTCCSIISTHSYVELCFFILITV